MKKVVLLVLPVIFLLFGFDYGMAEVAKVSPELAAARAKYDTPFIKKYRPRYEANIRNIGFFTIYESAKSECEKKCDREDKKNIKKLADANDMFSLFMHPQLQSSSKKQWEQFKVSADKGEPISLALYGFVTAGMEDYELGKKYVSMAKHYDSPDAHMKLMLIAAKSNKYEDFCLAAKNGYQKYGLEFLAFSFIYSNFSISNIFFSECTHNEPNDILSKAGNEGKLIQGYIHVRDEQYGEAYKLFNALYKQGDGSKISANAGYCLGMMNYYGKGVDKNIEKGLKLLEESFNNGVVYQNMPEREEFSFPPKLEMMAYRSGNCFEIQ